MKIKEIGKVVTGKTPSTKDEDNFGGSIPFATPEDIAKGYIVNDTIRHITEKGFESIKNNTFDGLSVMVGCIGSDMGNTAISTKRFSSNQQINTITKIKPIANPFYVYYFLSTRKEYLRSLAGSTATPLLPKSDFEEIDIPLPDRAIQDKVVEVLSTIDSKIENNASICTEIEKIAQLLYNYWFVQFDFPNENGKPYKSSGGKMVWNDELKKEIPEGWNVKALSEVIASSKNGDWGNESRKKDDDIEVTCFRGADFGSITSDYQVTAPTRYISANNADRLLSDGDLVTEISGGSPIQATGRIGYITQKFLDRNGGLMDCSNFCKAFTPIKKYYQFWLYQVWKSLYDAGNMFNYESKTTGIKNLMFEEFITWIRVPVPTEKLLKQYQEYCAGWYDKIQEGFIESAQLASLRDFLLPMLINGQIRVKA